MKELSEARKILGMEISRDQQHRKIYLSQKSYIEKLLSRYGMADSKPVSVPFAPHFKLSSKALRMRWRKRKWRKSHTQVLLAA